VRRFLIIVLCLLLLPAASRAGGGHLDLSLSAGGGYDSNVFVDYEGSLSPGVVASPFVIASPGLSLRVESGLLTLETPVDAAFRYFTEPDAGRSLSLHTRPVLSLKTGDLAASVGYLLESYAVSEFGADDNVYHAGAAAVRHRLWRTVSLGGGYEGGTRSFGQRWLEGIGEYQRNVEHRLFAGATIGILASLDAGVRYGFEYVDGNSDEFDETAHEVALRAVWEPLDRLLVIPSARARFKRYAKSGRDDRFFGEAIELRYGVTKWLACSAFFARSDNVSSEEGAGYGRNLAMLVLELEYPVRLWEERVETESGGETASPGAGPAARRGVERLRDRVFLFSYLAPGAKKVMVTGSFNGWAREGLALSGPDPNGVWSVEVDLPPGSTEFHFIVDGHAVPPQEAPAYVPDGFGGKNGVVTIE
jgi:hypothetical protein